MLSNSLEHVKGLLLAKMDPQSSKTQVELTVEIEQTVQHCLCKNFIHHASLNFIHHAYFVVGIIRHTFQTICIKYQPILIPALDIAGNTTTYVNKTIERNLPYV